MFGKVVRIFYKIFPKKRVSTWVVTTGICLLSPNPILTLVSIQALSIASSML